jgi:hypothetical protein
MAVRKVGVARAEELVTGQRGGSDRVGGGIPDLRVERLRANGPIEDFTVGQENGVDRLIAHRKDGRPLPDLCRAALGKDAGNTQEKQQGA